MKYKKPGLLDGFFEESGIEVPEIFRKMYRSVWFYPILVGLIGIGGYIVYCW